MWLVACSPCMNCVPNKRQASANAPPKDNPTMTGPLQPQGGHQVGKAVRVVGQSKDSGTSDDSPDPGVSQTTTV
jgi:hypothetical protein